MTSTLSTTPDEPDFTVIADVVESARTAALASVNASHIDMYWRIGSTILAQRQKQGWGSGVIAQLATYLSARFPDMKGLSRSNLQYARAFASRWESPDGNCPAAAGLLPWGHIMVILDKLETQEARDLYSAEAVKNGWSRNALSIHIANKTLERTGVAPSNFPATLTPTDSDLAKQVAKDPYILDFLDLTAEAAERDLEQAMVNRITETLRELGPGFAFVGRQVHLDVDGEDFYIDLLFFHYLQNRFVVVELKTGKFKPEYTGQLGFYVAVVDDTLRQPGHAPTVGILVCGSKNNATVRYALSATTSPVAVSAFTYETLPSAEQAALPDEAALGKLLEES